MIHVIVNCTLGDDAKTRMAGESEVTEFRAASNTYSDGKEQTTWFRVSWFGGRRASKVRQYLQKGAAVTVRGELYTREYQDRGGVMKTAVEIKADTVELGPKRGSAQQASSNGNGRHKHTGPVESFGSDMGVQNEIPF